MWPLFNKIRQIIIKEKKNTKSTAEFFFLCLFAVLALVFWIVCLGFVVKFFCFCLDASFGGWFRSLRFMLRRVFMEEYDDQLFALAVFTGAAAVFSWFPLIFFVEFYLHALYAPLKYRYYRFGRWFLFLIYYAFVAPFNTFCFVSQTSFQNFYYRDEFVSGSGALGLGFCGPAVVLILMLVLACFFFFFRRYERGYFDKFLGFMLIALIVSIFILWFMPPIPKKIAILFFFFCYWQWSRRLWQE